MGWTRDRDNNEYNDRNITEYVDRLGNVVENHIFCWFSSEEYFEEVKNGIRDGYHDYIFNMNEEDGLNDDNFYDNFPARRINFNIVDYDEEEFPIDYE